MTWYSWMFLIVSCLCRGVALVFTVTAVAHLAKTGYPNKVTVMEDNNSFRFRSLAYALITEIVGDVCFLLWIVSYPGMSM